MLMGKTFQSLGMLLLLMIPGFIFKKKNILSESQSQALNNFVVYVTWPCMVINAMQISFDIEILKNCGIITGKMLVVFLLMGFFGLFGAKKLKFSTGDQNLLIFMIIFGNTGFIGMPIIEALYGAEALFYASVLEAVNDILIFTVGIALVQSGAGKTTHIDLKQFLNPCFVGCIIGIILFLFQVQLPSVIGQPVEMLANATAPIAMSVLGYQLGELKIKDFSKDMRTYLTVAVKLFIAPSITLILIKILPSDLAILDKTLVIDMCMPIAVMIVLLSQRYSLDTDYATKSVLISTIGLIVSVPIFALLVSL